MKVTIDEARARLSELIEAVLAGAEVFIANGDGAIAQLVRVEKSGFKLGLLEGKLTGPPPDFLGPMSDEELPAWEGDAKD